MPSLQPRFGITIDRSNVYALRAGQSYKQPYKNREKLPKIKQRESLVAPEIARTQGIKQQHIPINLNRSLVIPKFETEDNKKIEEDKWTDSNSFIKALLLNKPEAISTFLYFNVKGDDPYDLEITTYAKRRKVKHFTISRKGVTKHENEVATEMVTLKEWLIEKEMYKELKTYSFFKNFHKWKVLNSWRTNVWTARRQYLNRELEDKMFMVDPIYREYLLKYRRHVWAISKLRLMDVSNSISARTLEDFSVRQLQKRKQAEAKIKECSRISREIIMKLINQALDRLKKRIMKEIMESNIKPPTKNTEIPDTRSTALRAINFPENMTYGHRSILRRECSRFLRLAYLLDFMIMQSLGDIYINSVKELLDTLSYLNDASVESNEIIRRMAKIDPIIIVDIKLDMNKHIPPEAIKQVLIEQFHEKISKAKDFDIGCHVEMMKGERVESSKFVKKYFKYEVEDIGKYWIETIPCKKTFYDTVLEHLNEGMEVLNTFECWSRHEMLKQYADVLEDWDDIIGDGWSPGEYDVVIPLYAIGDHPIYISYPQTLKGIVDSAYAKCNDFLKSLDKYLNICWRNKSSDFKILCSERICKPGETLSNIIKLFNYQKNVFAKKLPEMHNLGFIKIDCRPVREILLPIPGHYVSDIQHLMNNDLEMRLNMIEEWIRNAQRKLEVEVNSVDDYIVQRITWNEVVNAYKENKGKVDTIGELYDVMNAFELKVNKDGSKRYLRIVQEMGKINQLLENVSDQQELALDKNKKKLQDCLVPELRRNLEHIKAQIEDKVFLTYKDNVEDITNKIPELEEEFKKLVNKCKKYNEYEVILNVDIHNFEVVSEITEQLNLRKTLWNSLKEWKELTEKWIGQQFSAIDAKEINTTAEHYSQITLKLDNELPENPVSKQLKLKVDTFVKAVPIIKALRNEQLKKSHWKDIKVLLNAEFEITDPEFTLGSLFELEAAKYTIEIQQISTQATQENLLERKIASIDLFCKSCTFVIREDLVIANMSEIMDILDKCIVDIMAILDDRHIGPFLVQAEEWQKRLTGVSSVMHEWDTCQSQWIRLSEIFNSNELPTQLVGECTKFDAQDKFLKGLAQRAAKIQNPLKLIKIYKENLLEQLKYTNKVLDEIRHSLFDYAEAKQTLFPRFYFLTSKELLKILSNPYRLHGIDDYLPKLFDSVAKIVFNEHGEAIGVESKEGERLELFRPVRQKDTLEACLELLETGIKETLIRLIKASIIDYDEMDQKSWVNKYIVQVALTVSRMVWCNATENTILEQGTNPNALVEWYEELVHEVQQTTELTKNTLSSHKKLSITNLLLNKIHCKDIIEELILKGVNVITDYNWQKVLKFYWEEEDTLISVKALSYRVVYGSEYVFPLTWSVSNTVTDRSWLSIVGALSNRMTAVLVGSHEIGKTETLKSLAKHTAMYCVDVGCSQESTYKLFSRAIIGAISKGNWICIKGLDTIDIALLSIVSKQLIEIKRAFEKNAQSLFINEKEVPVKEGFGVLALITRNELVKMDGFRVINIMQPDVKYILGVILSVSGFKKPNVLANKLITFKNIIRGLLRNCSFGLQCLKMIVSTASTLRMKVNDNIAIVTAIKLLLEPKITNEDIEAFNSILEHIFPKIKPHDTTYDKKLIEVINNKGFVNTSVLVQKCMQLNELLKTHNRVIIVGCSASGKSTILKLTNETFNSDIKISKVNPNSLSFGELYGTMNSTAQEWKDGLIPRLLKEHQWLLFDGQITFDWISTITTETLALGNNERIDLTKAKILVETDSITTVSPGIISRYGILAVNDYIDSKSFIKYWLNKNTSMNKEVKGYIQNLFEGTIDRTLSKVKNSCDELTTFNDCQLLILICNILEVVLMSNVNEKRVITQAYYFAFVWGVGGLLDEGGRESIDSIARSVFESADIPPNQSLFEYYIDPNKGTGFRPWSDMIPLFTPKWDRAFNEIIVPSVETVRLEYFITNLVNTYKHIFITSNSTCGKSLIVNDIIERSNTISKIPASLPEANVLQHCIEQKLQNINSNVYGTAEGKHNVIFIDDAHLPLSSNSAVELIRRLIDDKDWYNNFNWKRIENTSVLCIGKCNNISIRLKRHFNQYFVQPLANTNFEYIFKEILKSNMKWKKCSETVQGFAQQIVSNTIFIYSTICSRVKAGPGRFTYLVNPRDLAKVFEGLCIGLEDSIQSLANLWMHEISRVFIDSMEEESNKDWINVLISDSATKIFKFDIDLRIHWSFINTPQAKVYKEVTDLNELKNSVEKELKDYMKVNSEGYNIVLHDEIVKNLLKIIHGLELSKDYLLIIGDAGAGKSTLVKLAAFIQRFKLREFKCEPFSEFGLKLLKELLLSTGVKGNSECLLIDQKSYKLPKEVLNMLHVLLLNGHIPGLFSREETEKILKDIRLIAIETKRNVSRKSLQKIFTERIKEKLKVVMTCEQGKWLQDTAKNYPSIIKSCRTIYLPNWSPETLQAISHNILEDSTEDFEDLIIKISREIHNSIISQAGEYNITSSFYLDVLKQYKVLAERYKEAKNVGYENFKKFKMKDSRSDSELEALLSKKIELSKQLQKEVVEMQGEISEIERSIEINNQEIEEKENKLKARNSEIEDELNVVQVKNIVRRLSQHDKNAFADLINTKVIEAIMLLLNENIDSSTIKDFLSDGNELTKGMSSFTENIENVEFSLVDKVIKEYINTEEFKTENKAIVAICVQWVEAVIKYYQALKNVAPRKRQLEVAKHKLNEEKKILKQRIGEVNEYKEKLVTVKAKYEKIQAEKKKIAEEISQAEFRSTRVTKFLEMFAEDEVRWNKMIQKKHNEKDRIGNLLFASLFIVYLGQFPMILRKKFIFEWISKLHSMGLHCDPNLYLKTEMIKNNSLQRLHDKGLPKSQLAIENAIIFLNSYKWPLIIDPHSFGNEWIKNKYKDEGLIVTKFSQKDYMRNLIYAISMEKPVLIEDVEDIIEPALEPIISKSIIVTGPRTSIVYIKGKEFDYDFSFKLFITTKGHIPVNAERMTMINFEADSEVLEEVLLPKLLMQEVPDEVSQGRALTNQITKDNILLKEIDEEILDVFASNSISEYIEDDKSYETIMKLKANYKSSLAKLQENEKLYADYLECIKEYKEIVKKVCVIYEVANVFALTFDEYKFSLQNFIEIFINAIKLPTPIPRVERITQIRERVISQLYNYIGQGMTKLHRIVFAFLICLRIQEIENKLEYLIRDELKVNKRANILTNIVDDKGWALAQVISEELPQFSKLLKSFSAKPTQWETYSKTGQLPKEWTDSLSPIDKLILSRAFCNKDLSLELIEFIKQSPITLTDNEDLLLEQSNKMRPMLIVASNETLVFDVVYKYALKRNHQERVHVMSLGSDQGQQVKKCLQIAQTKGDWIIINNCQYAENGELETLLEMIKEPKNPSHEDFHAFFSSSEISKLPKNLIERSIKLHSKGPEGIKERVIYYYSLISSIECSKKLKEFKRVLLGLCTFHAIVIEASKYKGFSKEYSFSNNHLIEATNIVKSLMEEEVLWLNIEFYIAETLYGDCIVNESDKKKLKAIFKEYCSQNTLNNNPFLVDNDMVDDCNGYLDKLPNKHVTDLFGIADKSFKENEIKENNRILVEVMKKFKLVKRVPLEEKRESSSMVNWITSLMEAVPLQLHITVSVNINYIDGI